MLPVMPLELDFQSDDIVVPFRVEALDIRGRVVRLGGMLDALLGRHRYPAPIGRLIGEAIALTVLMGSSLKFDGRFQLQARGDGPVALLVVDLTTPTDLRAYARFDAERLAALPGEASLLGNGHLAFTIEQGAQQSRYQGVVALDGQGLVKAAMEYLARSEQIPSVLRIAVAEEAVQTQDGLAHRWRVGGILAQFLPAAPERIRQRDLDPGDAPAGSEQAPVSEDDAWIEARALVETTEDLELVDPSLGVDRLLYRLFNERGVHASEPVGVQDRCRCSEQRIRETLQQFPAAEMADLSEADGQIAVTCEFCNRLYRLRL